jgi:hypothetical protein
MVIRIKSLSVSELFIAISTVSDMNNFYSLQLYL